MDMSMEDVESDWVVEFDALYLFLSLSSEPPSTPSITSAPLLRRMLVFSQYLEYLTDEPSASKITGMLHKYRPVDLRTC